MDTCRTGMLSWILTILSSDICIMRFTVTVNLAIQLSVRHFPSHMIEYKYVYWNVCCYKNVQMIVVVGRVRARNIILNWSYDRWNSAHWTSKCTMHLATDQFTFHTYKLAVCGLQRWQYFSEFNIDILNICYNGMILTLFGSSNELWARMMFTIY